MSWGKAAPPTSPVGEKSRFAAPPACPRCELTKSQMNRTIQNYQKAYRKKVEGLKQELSTTRADNTHLRSTVRRLRKKRLIHAPSTVIGAAAGFFVAKFVQIIRQRKQQQQPPQEEQHQQQQGSDAAAPAAVHTEEHKTGSVANGVVDA